MRMKKCPFCKQLVETSSTACPHCLRSLTIAYIKNHHIGSLPYAMYWKFGFFKGCLIYPVLLMIIAIAIIGFMAAS